MKATKRQSRRAQLLLLIFTVILLLSMVLGLIVDFRSPLPPTVTPGGFIWFAALF
jgi:hypothetical protein